MGSVQPEADDDVRDAAEQGRKADPDDEQDAASVGGQGRIVGTDRPEPRRTMMIPAMSCIHQRLSMCLVLKANTMSPRFGVAIVHLRAV